MSRPRFLDDAKRREIYALVSTGCSLETAARQVGCCARTIRREALRNPEFLDQLRQAETVPQGGPPHALDRAAESNRRAATRLLERGFLDQFALPEPAEFTSDQSEPCLLDVLDMIFRGVTKIDDLERVTLELAEIESEMRQEAYEAGRPMRDPSAGIPSRTKPTRIVSADGAAFFPGQNGRNEMVGPPTTYNCPPVKTWDNTTKPEATEAFAQVPRIADDKSLC